MPTSHKQIVRSMFEMLNQRNLDWIDLYVSDNFAFINETFISKGFSLKEENGKAIVDMLIENGPCAGRLQPGDEIISIQEADRFYDTVEELCYYPWGRNPWVTCHILARRNGELFDCQVAPVVEKGHRIPQTKDQMKEDMRNFYENNPEFNATVESLIEEGNFVAVIDSQTGLNQRYDNRPYAYSQVFLMEFAEDKILTMFEVHNTAVELVQQGYRILPPET